MSVDLFRNRVMAWVACFALLLGALAPTVSRYLASVDGVPPAFLDICSIQTERQASAGVSKAPGDPSDSQTMDRCAYCVLLAHVHAVLPGGLAWVFLPALRHGLPSLFFSAPTPQHAWSTALARAPPATLS